MIKRKHKLYGIFAVVFVFFLNIGVIYAQTTTTNYEGFTNCSGAINFYQFDFTSTSNNSLLQSVSTQNSDNQCCNLNNNFGCSMFEIITDPNAVGVTFTTSGPCGNVNFYYENCGATVTCSNQVCLDPNTNTHHFLMCRTGGPNYDFTFTQILAPQASPDIVTAVGCNQTLTVSGLTNPVWTSISPGPTRTYNANLSCTNCSTSIFTPNAGTPNTIIFQVSGTVTSPCSTLNWSDQVTVTTYPTLFANAGPDVAICQGNTLGVTLTGSAVNQTGTGPGGTAPYTFQWSGPQSVTHNNVNPPSPGAIATDNFQVTTPGTYTLTISDATGCPVANDQVVVSTFSFVPTANAGADVNVCRSPTPKVSLKREYQWRHSTIHLCLDRSEQLHEHHRGSYGPCCRDNNLTVTDANGNTGTCRSTLAVTFTEPTAALSVALTSQTNILCYGNTTGGANLTVSGGTPTYGYAWSNGSTAEDLSGVASGIYSVTVTDANSCTATASVTLTAPTQLVVSITVLSFYFGQGVSCEGASDGIINASGSGGTPEYNYSWNTSPPQNNVTVGGLPTGTYTVTVSDLNGCTATSSVTLTSNPLPQAKLPPPLIGCVGTGVLINANVESGEKCTWTFSDGQVFNQCGPFSVNFDAVDCYNVKLTVASPEGCTNTVSAPNFVCVEPNPVASFYADNYQIDNIQTTANFWNTSVGAESYFWYYSDGSNYDTTYNVYHEFQNGSDFDVINYMVILYAVSEYGCIDSTSRDIKLTPKPILYVPNAFTPDWDTYNSTFYPVLTAGYKSNDYEFLIFNRWGELIFESNTIGEGWEGTYKEHNCQDGVYTWKLVVGRSINGEQLEYTGHITLLRGGGL